MLDITVSSARPLSSIRLTREVFSWNRELRCSCGRDNERVQYMIYALTDEKTVNLFIAGDRGERCSGEVAFMLWLIWEIWA